MAIEHYIDFDALRRAAAEQGWFLTRERLGVPSGGGEAYVCIKSSLLEVIRTQVVGAVKVGASSDEPSEQAAALVRHLSKALAPDSGELGVFKVARRLDGRLKREISALSACNHPSLVPVLASAVGDEPDWYIMKLFGRGDLDSHWHEYQGKVVEVLKRTRDVAEALTVIHAKKLVHRDIKPKNIFIAADGRWVLGDFGSVFEDEATRQTLTGTAPMSKDWRPEWVVSRDVEKFEPVVDLHSLARVAYAMIAGPGKNPPVSQMDEPVFDLRQLHHGVEHIEEVQQFFMDHITHKAIKAKSQNAKDFIANLDALLALYSQRKVQQQVLSMVLTDATSWVSEGNLYLAQDLKLLLPPGITRLRVSVRLHLDGEQKSGSIKVAVRENWVVTERREELAADPEALRDFDEKALALAAAEVLVRKAARDSLGVWWDFEIRVNKPMPPKAFLSVERIPSPAKLTALMLVAEYMT